MFEQIRFLLPATANLAEAQVPMGEWTPLYEAQDMMIDLQQTESEVGAVTLA